ncbi:MAG TPA: flagellar biosynthesis anti-sigma factor FlgM [Nitrospirales bacterium]|nr:flagellar biosynthesis anti-sigma factor FlgM [Nitrospirales bacterium]
MTPRFPTTSFPLPCDPECPNQNSETRKTNALSLDSMAPSKDSPIEESSSYSSGESRNLEIYHDQIQHLPEIRKDRVAKIQRAIQEGSYSVTAKELADKLVKEL